MRETAHLFLARELTAVEEHAHDETEFIAIDWKPFDEVLQMVLTNDIVDSMTVIAVLTAARQLGL